MSVPITPAERQDADNALRLLREIPPTVSVLYAEVVRFQDGDRSAGGRAWELVEALRDQVRHLHDQLRRIAGQ